MARLAEERDRTLLLDRVMAARDAISFIEGMEEAAFMASVLHQNAVIRSLEVIGEAVIDGPSRRRRCTGGRRAAVGELTGELLDLNS